MNNKKSLIILMAILLVVTFSFFVSAVNVCCEKTNSGAWCQLEEESECSPSWSKAPTSCDQTTFCKKGTCVNEQMGTCTSNTAKGPCEGQGGTWYDKDKEDISSCKIGCCILGQEVAFINPTECQQLASDYGVDVNFRGDINSQAACFTLDTTEDKGACITEKDESTDCVINTLQGCTTQNGVFHRGLLCTAQGLSDCAKSSKTTCEKDKVYFLDTCGNLANVYDEDMYSENDADWNKIMRDYWEEIKDPECVIGASSISGASSSSICGDCNYRLGTICAKYKKEEGFPNNAPEFGENVCRELSCYYDTDGDPNTPKEKYSHTESWCAESPGTFFHVPIDLSLETTIEGVTKSAKEFLREGSSTYNLPGSRYYKLKCWDGEIITEPCKDYRNSVCRESVRDNEFRHADCIGNAAPLCPVKETKTECESETDCKWIPGYRRDGGRLIDEKDESIRENTQGACYPLFSPGLKFWESTAEQICSTNTITEVAFYELGLKIAGKSARKDWGDADPKDAAEKCLDNCYAIPYYGSTDTAGTYHLAETLKEFQLGEGTISPGIKDSYISRREGYYCLKDEDQPDTIDNSKTGKEPGDSVQCASNDAKDLDQRRVKLFYTHEQWLKTISDRTRSSGDCGYKPHAFFDITEYLGDPDSEKIDVSFNVLKQKGEVKYNVTNKEIIYKGDDMDALTPKDYRTGD